MRAKKYSYWKNHKRKKERLFTLALMATRSLTQQADYKSPALNIATRRPFFDIYRARAPESQNPNPKGILVIYYIFDSNEPSPMEAVQILNRTLRLNRIKC